MKLTQSYRFSAIASFLVYVLVAGAIIFCDTAYFGMGDPKFGESGWQIYWPIWAILYAPVTIAGLVAARFWQFKRVPVMMRLLTIVIAVIVCLETSFIIDAQLPLVIEESIALFLVFVAMAIVPRIINRKASAT